MKKAVFVKLGKMKLEIWAFDKQEKKQDDYSNLKVLGIKHLAFRIKDIEKKVQELRAKGITISEPEKGGSESKYAFLKDPDGFPIELYEDNL